jgi:hypothetical protein
MPDLEPRYLCSKALQHAQGPGITLGWLSIAIADSMAPKAPVFCFFFFFFSTGVWTQCLALNYSHSLRWDSPTSVFCVAGNYRHEPPSLTQSPILSLVLVDMDLNESCLYLGSKGSLGKGEKCDWKGWANRGASIIHSHRSLRLNVDCVSLHRTHQSYSTPGPGCWSGFVCVCVTTGLSQMAVSSTLLGMLQKSLLLD